MKNSKALWYTFFSIIFSNNIFSCPTCLGRSHIDSKSCKDLYKIEKEYNSFTANKSTKQQCTCDKKEINNETEQVNVKEQS